MTDQRAYLRIREGAFTYLLAAGRTASIEHRNSGGFEGLDDPASPLAAWHGSGDARVPVIRLGRVMQTRAGDWEYAILFGGDDGIGLAAEHIHLVPESGIPDIQPFRPAGCSLAGGPVISGLCPGIDPEYLVLDTSRLELCLRRAVEGSTT
ncbi:MAG: hypothetical protein U5R46_16160 [Gammaproteobacteria bacterium]|nr:hypothetical protein [Gammaproteobacteria bacterium]